VSACAQPQWGTWGLHSHSLKSPVLRLLHICSKTGRYEGVEAGLPDTWSVRIANETPYN